MSSTIVLWLTASPRVRQVMSSSLSDVFNLAPLLLFFILITIHFTLGLSCDVQFILFVKMKINDAKIMHVFKET